MREGERERKREREREYKLIWPSFVIVISSPNMMKMATATLTIMEIMRLTEVSINYIDIFHKCLQCQKTFFSFDNNTYILLMFACIYVCV